MRVIRERRFKHGAVNHVYQRTLNRFNIFYDLHDYLVYFTIFCTVASKYGICVYSLCLMIDHIHSLIASDTKDTLSRFISNVTSVFVKEYNSSVGRTGPLFEGRFGSAPKTDRKKLVSAIIYLANNPVEKKLCSKAEKYRWNFIAYMDSSHPFSDPIIKYKASVRLRKAMAEVSSCVAKGQYLNYARLRRMMDDLSVLEKNQLVDYIISSYNVINYKKVSLYFESYNQMLVSIHSTTGSEYDLIETVDRFSDGVYRDMIVEMKKYTGTSVKDIIMFSNEDKRKLADELHRKTEATDRQIAKFLHISDTC